MKTKYKIAIIASVALFIYWPVIPLVALSCQQLTDDEICFDIARLRIPNPIPEKEGWKYQQDTDTDEEFASTGTKHSIQEMLSDPSLIRIEKTGEKSIRLEPDGKGPQYSCASLSILRLSQDRLDTMRSGAAPQFLSITDEDLNNAPQLKELIAATHQIAMPYNDSVNIHFDGIEFVQYEFFLMDRAIEKYGDTKEDYFMDLSEDYEERFANPEKQGLSNNFHAPRIVYEGKVYGFGHTTFWTSDEHNLRMSIHLLDSTEDKKFITLTEEDMEQIPKIKEGIEGIGKTQEYVRASKQVPEPEWNYYREWYNENSIEAFDSNHEASGFVYDDEYYQVGFGIC
jgi:hypothetical protein